jgi:hypothetical protein
LVGLIGIGETLKFMRVLLVGLVDQECLNHTKAFGFDYLFHIVQWDDELFGNTHNARIEADVVLCNVHSTLMKDALGVSTAEVVEDDLFLRQREEFSDL